MWFGQVAPGAVVRVVFSPDSRTLYTFDAMARIFAWDTTARTGRKIVAHNDPDERGHPTPTPDGRHLVCYSSTHFALRDAATGRVVRREPFPDEWKPSPIHLSADTRYFSVMGFEGRGFVVRRWDWTAGAPERLKWDWPADLPSPLAKHALHPDGRTLAVAGSGGNVVLFDLATGAERARLDTPLARHADRLRFSPSGDRLLLLGNELGALDAATGRRLWTRKLSDQWPTETAFHPTRPILGLTIYDYRTKYSQTSFVHPDTGEPLALPDPGFKGTVSLAFAPDGLTCAIGSAHRQFAVFDLDL